MRWERAMFQEPGAGPNCRPGSRNAQASVSPAPKGLALLGIHCFGHSAAEINPHWPGHHGRSRRPNNSLLYFANTTFNYPTMAEAYRVAALNGINRVF